MPPEGMSRTPKPQVMRQRSLEFLSACRYDAGSACISKAMVRPHVLACMLFRQPLSAIEPPYRLRRACPYCEATPAASGAAPASRRMR